ncbi:hypothetical protein KUL25_04635 [Rhodobacteraceae bacterium N5(2021)]|uniref:Peptidase A2 domain-containing protein n=1 Tax=Gymnodinialimonas phycosphaerae TaxID=2841589 RepID=A0A975YGS6_9RHOB|nr:hypothetical protein [Gymnodinialimonas phycosphaerae]MBY4892046.1 hypothetical protein [Gymnodinialimonas phycosphaerae]
MRALALILVTLLPGQAGAVGLACTFTMICSPLTDCQTHPGVPFRFDVLSGAYSFVSDGGLIFGTPLSHIAAPAIAVLFESGADSTILLTVSGGGEAVMTQQDLSSAGGVQSVSYFGTCEPDA